MSTNCIRCVVNKRTGLDLLCDDCRDPMIDGYYWVALSPSTTPQVVSVLTGTAWSTHPSTERRTFVMFMGLAARILLDDFLTQYPAAKWSECMISPLKGGA